MLPYILIGLYLLVAIFVYCIKEEMDKRKGIYVLDNLDNAGESIFWLPILIFNCIMLVIIFIGEYIIHKPISFILKHTFRPLTKKIIKYLESEPKKEN